MKEIGEEFLQKREEIGVKKEEVAADLNITVAQLDNLENGYVNAFKDISFLKELVVKYAKYLNLDDAKMLERFNSFVFDFTSKIPMEQIEEKVKEINKELHDEEKKKVLSPYTKTIVKKKKKNLVRYCIIILLIIILIGLVLFIAFHIINK